MGACLCCMKNSKAEVEMSHLSTTTNAAVTCKCGLLGKNIKCTHDSSNNYCKIEGSGTALGSCPLDCDTAYWEVRIGEKPAGVRVGVKRFNTKKTNVNSLDSQLDTAADSSDDSWCLRGVELKTNDVVGVYWDQTDLPMLSFTVNGKELPNSSHLRIRPTQDIVAAVSVESGSSCEMIFDGDHFLHTPKSSKFQMIICATSLI